MSEALNVYKNLQTGEFLIQRYSGIHAVGKFLRLSTTEMQRNGFDTVLALLENPLPSDIREKSELATFPKDEEKLFYSQHRHVVINLSGPQAMKIFPLYKKGSCSVAPRDQAVEIEIPCSGPHFLDELNKVFANM